MDSPARARSRYQARSSPIRAIGSRLGQRRQAIDDCRLRSARRGATPARVAGRSRLGARSSQRRGQLPLDAASDGNRAVSSIATDMDRTYAPTRFGRRPKTRSRTWPATNRSTIESPQRLIPCGRYRGLRHLYRVGLQVGRESRETAHAGIRHCGRYLSFPACVDGPCHPAPKAAAGSPARGLGAAWIPMRLTMR